MPTPFRPLERELPRSPLYDPESCNDCLRTAELRWESWNLSLLARHRGLTERGRAVYAGPFLGAEGARVIVEFIGPPGAGKSTLAREVADAYGYEVMKVNAWGAPVSRLGRLAAVGRHVPLAIAAVRLGGLGTVPVSKAINLCRRQQQMAALPAGVVVEDGPLMALSRMARDRPGRDIAPVVTRLTAPDVCVAVSVPPEVSLYRLATYRGGNNAALKIPEREAVAMLRCHLSAMEVVTDALAGLCQVVWIDNSDDGAVEASSKQLIKRLASSTLGG